MGVLETLRSVARFRRFELDPAKRRLSRAACVEDLQNPLTSLEMWNLLREPNFQDLDIR